MSTSILFRVTRVRLPGGKTDLGVRCPVLRARAGSARPSSRRIRPAMVSWSSAGSSAPSSSSDDCRCPSADVLLLLAIGDVVTRISSARSTFGWPLPGSPMATDAGWRRRSWQPGWCRARTSLRVRRSSQTRTDAGVILANIWLTYRRRITTLFHPAYLLAL